MAIIRDALEGDLEPIKNILEINGQLGDVDNEEIKYFVVAEVDGRIIGCGMLKNYDYAFEIRKVPVLPGYQRGGIGKEIALTLLERAKGRKCWLLSVDSHSFWEQFGFYIMPEEEEPIEAKEYCENCRQRLECNRVVMFREGRMIQ